MHDVGEIIHLGVTQFNRGDFVGAAALAKHCLQHWPDDGRLWELYGLARRHLGELDCARNALETATCLVALTPAAQLALADCYLADGQTALARQMYRYLATLRCTFTEGLLLLGGRLVTVGEYERAVAVYRVLLRQEPQSHEARFGMALALRRLGRSLKAILPLVVEAHAIAPEVTTYRLLLATIYVELGQKDEAYDLLHDLDPAVVSCCGCLHRMLTVFRMMGDCEKCRACDEQIERRADEENGEGRDED